jgi:hypothetical protein
MTPSGDQWPPADRDGPAADLAGNPGVIATTLLSGVIAVAVAAAEWVGSGQGLDSPAGILWSVVALLGVVAMLLGAGLELRRRRQAARQVAAPRGLAAHPWPEGFAVRVRMGLHTGEGVLGGDNYVGIDVNRAARIAGAAHGGQVIVSGATRGLVEHAVPEGTSVRDLGEHRLRDLNLPMRLYDLVIEGLPADFLPPRTLDARPGNLPAQLTSFVGRERETDEARRLLGRTRLLTLTGAGGTGKSRLALQVAAELLPGYRDGAFFADAAEAAPGRRATAWAWRRPWRVSIGAAAADTGPVRTRRGGGGAMDRDRDRDLDGVPDWQEDENYADEAPIAGPGSPRARMRGGGCALPVALLLVGAGLAARRRN